MNERAPNCRNTQTPSCNRSPITARTSWSRWSTLWRSRADRTGLDHGAESCLLLSSCFSFPFFTGCQHTNSLTLTHMHKSKDRHIRERLTAHKSSARLDWLRGVGMVGFPSAIPYHHIHPVYTHINMGKKKPKGGNGRRGKLSITRHVHLFSCLSWKPVLREVKFSL